jgi:hypothetical protein
MRRVIYCPSDTYIDEASELAKKTGLPINIGIFESIESLNFDHNIVQVLEVPELRSLQYQINPNLFFHQKIDYINDYTVFNKAITLIINESIYKPIIVEKNRVTFSIYETIVGEKKCSIMNGYEKLEEFQYNVN